jgi:hypothetical protein
VVALPRTGRNEDRIMSKEKRATKPNPECGAGLAGSLLFSADHAKRTVSAGRSVHEIGDRSYLSETRCSMQSFETVLIELTVRVTDDGAPPFAKASELVLSEGDVFPVTSTFCPR